MTLTDEQQLELMELEAEVSSLPIEARKFKITDQSSMALVDSKLAADYQVRDRVLAYHLPNIEAAKKVLDAAKAAHNTATLLQAQMLGPVDQAINTWKMYISDFKREQDRKREELERVERDKARKREDEMRARQIEDARAAAQRESDRRILESTTKEELEAAIRGSDGDVAQAVESAKEAPLPVVASSTLAVMPEVKSKTVTVAYLYSAEVVAPMLLFKAVGEGKASSALVKPDTTAINRLAVALKEGFSVPGCRLVKKESARRKAGAGK